MQQLFGHGDERELASDLGRVGERRAGAHRPGESQVGVNAVPKARLVQPRTEVGLPQAAHLEQRRLALRGLARAELPRCGLGGTAVGEVGAVKACR